MVLRFRTCFDIFSPYIWYQNRYPCVIARAGVRPSPSVYSALEVRRGLGTKIVLLRVPYYGQSNSAPRGSVSVPFFSE